MNSFPETFIIAWYRMGEFSIIRRLMETSPEMPGEVLVGPGDDAAVISGGAYGDNHHILTVDAMVEGVHFLKDTLTPYQTGRRSITVAVSDIAAMGGKPAWALVSCGLNESEWPEERVLELVRGMRERLEEFGAVIIGGNLTRSEQFFISTTAGGICSSEPMRRKGARPGDLIVVSGVPGGASIGLNLVREGKRTEDHPLVNRHVDPPARVREGLLLRGAAHACIDISDGLLQDLGHILNESGVGAILEAGRIPLPDTEGLPLTEESRLHAALTGGEDYELLAAIPPKKEKRIEEIASQTGTVLTVIGRCSDAAGEIKMIDKNGNAMTLPSASGWDHFRKGMKT